MTQDYYTHPQETWSAKKCERMAKHTAKDGMGTKYPFKGYIGSSQPNGGGWGRIRYNGGCTRNGVWYVGEIRPLPIVAPGYKIVAVPAWGYKIVKEKQCLKST